MMRRLPPLAPAVLLVLLVSACLGGQSKQTKEEASLAGDQSRGVPPKARAERDWKEAAQGHDAAGAIPPEDLARMDRLSVPGARIQADAGASSK